jgi:hypothetical protein
MEFGNVMLMLIDTCSTYSIPEIIFSYSSHHGTWLSILAFSSSCVFFDVAAIVVDDCIPSGPRSFELFIKRAVHLAYGVGKWR